MLLGNFRESSAPIVRAAFAAAALILVGCTSQPASQSAVGGPSVVQASDTSQATKSSDSTVSMAIPTGDKTTSDLLLEETTPREIRVGQPLNYSIRVTNLRSTPLTGVVLEQRVPKTLQLASDAPANSSGNADGKEDRKARIEVGDLAPKESKTVQMSATASAKGSIDTCLSARYNPPTLCTMVSVVAPTLRITGEGPSQSDICADLTYHYTITNTGTGTAHNVMLEENLPTGLQTVNGKQTISSPVGDLAAGQSKGFDLHLKPSQSGKFASQAYARSDDAGRAQAEQVATTVTAPRLSVTVAGPKEEYLGTQVVYQVTVKNEGDAPAANAKVRLGATPGSVAFVSAQNASGSKISQEQPGTGQDLGVLAPGESRTAAITFNTQREGDLTLEATAEAKCAQPVTTPVSTRILTITASALVVTHDPDPVRVGTNVKYHIVVVNKGTAADHNMTVTTTLPAGLEYVSGTGTTPVTNSGPTITFAPIAELAPKQTAAWDVIAKALQPQDVEVRVSMTSDATKTPAVKVEPTKLYGDINSNQQKTNVAPAPMPATTTLPSAPADSGTK